jgi:hypothetical protein
MPFADANSQLEPLMFQMKQYKNLTKSTIEVLPSSGQTNYGPNQKCIFTLPYASLISLEDLALHFEFAPSNVPKTPSGQDCIRVSPPKDVASLISEIDIKINGQTIQHLTNYNDIVNILNLFEDAKTAKKVLQGADINNTHYYGGNKAIVPIVDTNYIGAPNANNQPKEYVVNNWYGLLGHRGKEVSSNFIDTNMMGEVTIAFTFAPASVCVSSAAATEAEVKATTNPPNASTTGEVTTAMLKRNETYSLSNLKMSMVRYNLPMEYSQALSSNLSGGAKYQIAFNHYEMHSQEANASDGTIRWNENSKDIKGLLAFFTNKDRANTTYGSVYDSSVETSKYFKYDNPIHNSSQFQIGSVKMPQNALNSTGAFLELTRGIAGVRGNNVEFFNQINSVERWLDSYFMAYLSLEMTEGMDDVASGGKKLLSGLSSENLPISCSYNYTNEPLGGYTWGKNVNVMTLSTRMLVIESGQKVYTEI